eukprot:322561-Chlamydomonas_euryale.AAC.11
MGRVGIVWSSEGALPGLVSATTNALVLLDTGRSQMNVNCVLFLASMLQLRSLSLWLSVCHIVWSWAKR